jgi:hypothetical protein
VNSLSTSPGNLLDELNLVDEVPFSDDAPEVNLSFSDLVGPSPPSLSSPLSLDSQFPYWYPIQAALNSSDCTSTCESTASPPQCSLRETRPQIPKQLGIEPDQQNTDEKTSVSRDAPRRALLPPSLSIECDHCGHLFTDANIKSGLPSRNDTQK